MFLRIYKLLSCFYNIIMIVRLFNPFQLSGTTMNIGSGSRFKKKGLYLTYSRIPNNNRNPAPLNLVLKKMFVASS
jgi:hypothetical protein